MPELEPEEHAAARSNWLRAAVLGANDGIVSTAALVVGVAAATTTRDPVVIAAIAGLLAGGASMAVGEYVSVAAAKDAQQADVRREAEEHATDPEGELVELARIYEDRGVSPATARAVAAELSAADALGAHARDELGITETLSARPLQAGLASAASFATGGAIPLLAVLLSPTGAIVPAVVTATLLALLLLGVLSATAGGARRGRAVLRILVGGTAAMLVTFGGGALLGNGPL
ncbi:VIT1/CCC1 transporter family protein [Nitriliruptor alkaliphilus]|uniref:VIT1/CCC1 transporter family protein n=1 Tax=Nitriliruptor alkaliphilus TaxID=427918 RepID=UPI000ABC9F0F|nr:VIT1/CCC1 transporter family protein [Nitriliruptor alkaliphilus]